MIPDERRYPIIDIVSERKIGTLGEEFMALRARIGLNFICKGRVWRIVKIEDETGEVYVVPSEDTVAAIPGWDGEMVPVSIHLAEETSQLREEIVEELKLTEGLEEAIQNLAKRFAVEPQFIREAVREVHEHLKRGFPLPTRRCIVLEGFDRFVVIHACFGDIVNRTLGCILDAVLSDHEMISGWWNDAYRVLIETPMKVKPPQLERISSLIFGLSEREIDEAFNEYLEARFPFTDRMKFVAERFGLLPRGRLMGPGRLAELPRRLKSTPIYDDTVREVMMERIDLETAKRIIASVKSGEARVERIFSKEAPSPLAYHILAKYSEIPELMAPRHVLLSNIERMKRAISAHKVRLLCLSCDDWLWEGRVHDVPLRPLCGKCGSGLVASLKWQQDLTRLKDILRSRLRGDQLNEEEVKELSNVRRTADLVLSYGKQAIVALEVKGVGPETASRILGKMLVNEEDFYLELLKAKIQFLRTRQYWNDQEERRRLALH
jgi:ATP-dependent Lhr-like helicase